MGRRGIWVLPSSVVPIPSFFNSFLGVCFSPFILAKLHQLARTRCNNVDRTIQKPPLDISSVRANLETFGFGKVRPIPKSMKKFGASSSIIGSLPASAVVIHCSMKVSVEPGKNNVRSHLNYVAYLTWLACAGRPEITAHRGSHSVYKAQKWLSCVRERFRFSTIFTFNYIYITIFCAVSRVTVTFQSATTMSVLYIPSRWCSAT